MRLGAMKLPTLLSRQDLFRFKRFGFGCEPTAGLQGRRREAEHLHEQVVALLGVLLHQVLQQGITVSGTDKNNGRVGERRGQGKTRGACRDGSAPSARGGEMTRKRRGNDRVESSSKQTRKTGKN